MRDERFVAVHRGGQLAKDNHHKIIKWVRECSEHVLPLFEGEIDKRLVLALHVAKDWENENATVGDTIKASLSAYTVARESADPALKIGSPIRWSGCCHCSYG